MVRPIWPLSGFVLIFIRVNIYICLCINLYICLYSYIYIYMCISFIYSGTCSLHYNTHLMFRSSCIIIYQYSETNVMHILFKSSNHGAANWHNTHAVYKVHLCSTSWGLSINARNIQKPLIVNNLNKKCTTLVSLSW
jgi:hypothetical protein